MTKRIMIDTEGFTGRPSDGIGPIVSIGLYDGLSGVEMYLDWYNLGSVPCNTDTLKWWFDNGLIPKTTASHSTSDALAIVWKWVHEADEVWCRGPDYDMAVIEHWTRQVGMEVPKYAFAKYRCHRTVVPKMDKTNGHTALSDAMNQWDALHRVFAILPNPRS